MSDQTYTIDPVHSMVEFKIRHLMISTVRGRFTDVSGTIVVSDGDAGLPTRVDVVAKSASIDTREAQRDGHLRSADFFDAENHPDLTFVSSSFEPNADGFTMRGALTIRGVSKDVAFETTFGGREKDPMGNSRVGYEARAKISRKDYGLTFNIPLESGNVAIGDEVRIEIAVEAILKA